MVAKTLKKYRTMTNIPITTDKIQNRYIAVIGLGLTGLSVLIGILVFIDNKRHSRVRLENEKLQREINTMELALKQKQIQEKFTGQ